MAPIRRLRNKIKLQSYYVKDKFCPICEKSSKQFKTFGLIPRKDAQCPICGSLERHRLVFLFLQQRTNFFKCSTKKMLHIAPEKCFNSIFSKNLGNNYLTADLLDTTAMEKMDICNINYPDNSFDIIYCSHVLEHVPDDQQAMKEFCRVLKTDGWAILNVPITCQKTLENKSIVDPKERLKVFGQKDHVRRYGPDYIDRLRNAGFTVQKFKTNDLVKEREAVRMGLNQARGEIFFCTKV